MKLFKKSTMSLALTAAMIGGAAISQQVSAMPTGAAATGVAAGAPYVNVNGLGQALIFPYYSVRGGLKSFFNITNTSNATVAVKVRFREGQNSRDALDFNIVLSPEDVWTGWIQDGASGPVVRSNDNSCTIGAPDIGTTGQPLSNVAYGNTIPNFEDQGPNSIDRTREGYVEVLAMGQIPATGASAAAADLAADALHVQPAGIPFDCPSVDAAFVAAAPDTLPVAFPLVDNVALPGPAIEGDGDAPAALLFESFATGENPLKGNFSVVNAGSGIGGGNAAVAIADFMNPAILTPGTEGINLITAQNFPYFLEPTLTSRDGIWTTSGLPLVEAAMASSTIINEWANNPNSGAATDWAVTFPTKGFHVDNQVVDSANPGTFDYAYNLTVADQNIQASNNRWRGGNAAAVADVVPVGPTAAAAFSPLPAPFQDNINADGAAVEIGITGYNREENSVVATTGNTTPSPFPPGGVTALVLQGEANLISYGPQGTPSALGGENFVLNFDVSATLSAPAPNGWAQLDFAAANPLPTVGYAFKSRNQGDATLSFSQILNHAWK